MLFSPGAPLTPIGGSSWRRLKSLISRRRAAVDILIYQKNLYFVENGETLKFLYISTIFICDVTLVVIHTFLLK